MEKTVAKALTLVEALGSSDGPKGVTQLGRELGLTKSNVHRLLETLREMHYVVRHDNGTYSLSLKFWQIGRAAIAQFDLRDIAVPFLRELVAKTDETARLTVFENDQGICIQQIQSANPIGVMTRIGGSLMAYCSATGKALLAYQPEEVIQRVASGITSFTARTVAGGEALREELALIRDREFAINYGEWRDTVSGVAAPVRDSDGNVVAAIGVSGPSSRLDDAALEALGPMLRDTAQRLSVALGYTRRAEA